MAEYRYYLIPDFMSHVFPQQFEEQAPTEFFSNTALLDFEIHITFLNQLYLLL